MILAGSLPKWQIQQNLQQNSFFFKTFCMCTISFFNGQTHKFSQFLARLYEGGHHGIGVTQNVKVFG